MTAPTELTALTDETAPEAIARDARTRVLDVRSLLAWTNARIRVVKQLRRHRHDDAAWWAERGTDARATHRERETLRQVANLLHVERATSRGRLHGFATLDEQREWLARMERQTCWRAADYVHVARESTLIALRAGHVVQERDDVAVQEREDVVPPGSAIVAVQERKDARVEGIDARAETVES